MLVVRLPSDCCSVSRPLWATGALSRTPVFCSHLDNLIFPARFRQESLPLADRTLPQLAEQFDVHPNQITSWKAQLEKGAADVFGPGGGNGAAQPAVDLKSLHAKIGELTLENDFLEGALNKAGLLSAKR
jgi:transposase